VISPIKTVRALDDLAQDPMDFLHTRATGAPLGGGTFQPLKSDASGAVTNQA